MSASGSTGLRFPGHVPGAGADRQPVALDHGGTPRERRPGPGQGAAPGFSTMALEMGERKHAEQFGPS